MKKIFLLITVAAVLNACNNEIKSGSADSDSTSAKSPVTLPYTASYSSSFEMGNPEFSATILKGSWKDWENNNIDNMKSWVADTVVAFHSDNSMVRGVDSLIATWKRNRAQYKAVIDTINAVIPVFSTDKKENWVLVWATEINTKMDDSKDTVALMETWRINKDGKADLLFQFERQKRKE
ncbi:MAG: hypothetical protein H7122_06565 [Chitinophagaceae bacterium]|nr:hypothetical protein [Chitinophagaceae bacterium]